MASLAQRISNWFKPKEEIKFNLDEQSVKESVKIRAIANQNAELKVENAILKKQIGEKRESEDDVNEDEQTRFDLNEQEEKFSEETKPSYLSLRDLFTKILRNENMGKSLGFYTWDRGERLGTFWDIGFCPDGDLALVDDKKKVLVKLPRAVDIFQSVPGLANDIQTYKIPLNLNSDGSYQENPLVWDAPEIIPTSDGKYKYAKAKKKPFYELLNELRQENSEKHDEIEELETTVTKLSNELAEARRIARVADKSDEISRKNTSEMEKSYSSLVEVFGRNSRELATQRNVNLLLEDNLEQLSDTLEVMRKKAEGTDSQVAIEQALNLVRNISNEVRATMPPIEVKPKEPETKTVPLEKE